MHNKSSNLNVAQLHSITYCDREQSGHRHSLEDKAGDVLYFSHIANKSHKKNKTNIRCILLTSVCVYPKPDISYSSVP